MFRGRTLVLLLVSSGLFAQTPPPKPQAKAQELVAPYWTAEPGWHTEFKLKNNMTTGSLTVTPVLRLRDGHEFPLASAAVPARDVVTVTYRTK
jgi:hypothetical protein